MWSDVSEMPLASATTLSGAIREIVERYAEGIAIGNRHTPRSLRPERLLAVDFAAALWSEIEANAHTDIDGQNDLANPTWVQAEASHIADIWIANIKAICESFSEGSIEDIVVENVDHDLGRNGRDLERHQIMAEFGREIEAAVSEAFEYVEAICYDLVEKVVEARDQHDS